MRMLPAHQGFDADQLVPVDRDLGLVVQHQLAGLDAPGDVGRAVLLARLADLRRDEVAPALDQLLQRLGLDGLLQVAQHRQVVGRGQAGGGVEHALVGATDQRECAGIAAAHQVAHELHAIHAGHVQVEQQQDVRRGPGIQPFQRLFAGGASLHRGHPERGELLAHQLQLEALVVDDQHVGDRHRRGPRGSGGLELPGDALDHALQRRLEAGQQRGHRGAVSEAAELLDLLAHLAECHRPDGARRGFQPVGAGGRGGRIAPAHRLAQLPGCGIGGLKELAPQPRQCGRVVADHAGQHALVVLGQAAWRR